MLLVERIKLQSRNNTLDERWTKSRDRVLKLPDVQTLANGRRAILIEARRWFLHQFVAIRRARSQTVGPPYILVSYIDDLGVGTSTAAPLSLALRYIRLYGASIGPPSWTGSRAPAPRYSYRHSARRALSSRPLAVVIVTRPDEPVGRSAGGSIEPPC